MTFTYSSAAPTAVHKVRLLIADTVQEQDGATVYVFDDEELQTLLDLYGGNLFSAAAAAIRSRIADLAHAYSITAGQRGAMLTVSASTAATSLEALADKYEAQAALASGPDLLDWRADDLDEIETLLQRQYHRPDDEADGTEFV